MADTLLMLRNWRVILLASVSSISLLACGDSGGEEENIQPTDSGVSIDANSSEADAAVNTACLPQKIEPCTEECEEQSGAYWDGTECRPLYGDCSGEDCSATYSDLAQCIEAKEECMPSSCATEAKGFCQESGKACALGFGEDAENSELCGSDKCCTECPDEESSDIQYISRDPAICGVQSFECGPMGEAFNNDCGCGCKIEEGAQGDICGSSAFGRECGEELACCYPCGIQGCDFTCVPKCDPALGIPCAGDCPLTP